MTARAGAFVLGAALLAGGCGERSRVPILVGERVESVAGGTTLAQAMDRLGLRAPAGNLLDVEGNVLRASVFPGAIVLNGRRAAASTRLQAGDRIGFVAGRNRTERFVHERVPVDGGVSPNPQLRLVRTPGVRVVVRGAVSGKIVAMRYRPTEGPETLQRAVALTFDDGPSPDTPRLLRVLRRLHARATFFVVGYLADWYPEIVAREHEAGMAVGNHTYNHPQVPPFNSLPRRLLDAEIQLGAKSIARAGVSARLLRPPAGSTSSRVVRAASAAGERVVLWSVDAGDWRPGVTPREIKRNVLDAVEAGSIVVMHDGGGQQAATITALPGIVKGIRRMRLRLVTLTPS